MSIRAHVSTRYRKTHTLRSLPLLCHSVQLACAVGLTTVSG